MAGLKDQEQFSRAWNAASRGERDVFLQLMPALKNYLLYPYLQYEDFRFRRANADTQKMAAFLDGHSDWAFTAGLRTAWLKSLGEKARWDSLLKYAKQFRRYRGPLLPCPSQNCARSDLWSFACRPAIVGGWEIPAGRLRSGVQMAQGSRWDNTRSGLGASSPGYGGPPTPVDPVPGAICPG